MVDWKNGFCFVLGLYFRMEGDVPVDPPRAKVLHVVENILQNVRDATAFLGFAPDHENNLHRGRASLMSLASMYAMLDAFYIPFFGHMSG